MNMRTVVLDTNVLISALVFGGKPRKVLDRIIKGQLKMAVSKEILDEMEGVLTSRKFQYSRQISHSIRNALEEVADLITPQKTVKAIKNDPDDNRILECALAAGADIIISGNRHLLELKQYRGINIITPSDFLNK